MKLRVLDETDVDLVCDLEERIFSEDPWTRGMVEEELSSPWRVYLLAVGDGGEPLGYGGVSVGPDADIMTIGVLSTSRGLGLGNALMGALLQVAKDSGSSRCFLEVRASNAGAISLYEKWGFVQVNTLKGYFKNPREDGFLMRKEFTESVGVVGSEVTSQ